MGMIIYIPRPPTALNPFPFSAKDQSSSTQGFDRWRRYRVGTAYPRAGGPNGGSGGGAANTIYVTKTGNDSTGDGSLGNPYLTIGKGISVMVAGDTVSVGPGTYSEQITGVPNGTSWSAGSFSLICATSTAPVLNPSTTFVVDFEADYHYIELRDLVLDGTNVSSDTVRLGWDGVGGHAAAHHIKFTRVEAKNNTNALSQAFNVFRTTTSGATDGGNCEWLDCIVHDNGDTDNLSQGIYLETDNNIIDGCLVYNQQVNGITIYNNYTAQSANNNIIRNCIVHHNGLQAPPVGFGTGITIGSGDNNIAYNNVVYKNNNSSGGGIYVASFGAPANPTNTKLYNNTVVSNSNDGILVNSDASNTVLTNNIVYNNGSNYTNLGTGTTTTTNLNIPSGTTDPLFTSSASDDYSLQAGSSGVDTGTSLSSTFTTDINGTSRPQGSAWDKGAYER